MITIYHDTGDRIVFQRDGRIYRAGILREGDRRVVASITSADPAGRFHVYSPERHPYLYAALEEAI